MSSNLTVASWLAELVARFHRPRLLTWAFIGADCHGSPTHGTHKKLIKIIKNSTSTYF